LTHGAKRIAHSDLGHAPSASLGHYAPLSFVAIGRSQRSEDRSANFGFPDLRCWMGDVEYGLPFTVYGLPFTVYAFNDLNELMRNEKSTDCSC